MAAGEEGNEPNPVGVCLSKTGFLVVVLLSKDWLRAIEVRMAIRLHRSWLHIFGFTVITHLLYLTLSIPGLV